MDHFLIPYRHPSTVFQRTCIQIISMSLCCLRTACSEAPVPVCPQFPTGDLELENSAHLTALPRKASKTRDLPNAPFLIWKNVLLSSFLSSLNEWFGFFVLFSADLLWCKFTYHVSFRCTMSQSDVCTYCEMITPEVHLTQSQNIFLKIYSSSNPLQRCSTVLLILVAALSTSPLDGSVTASLLIPF